MEPHDLDSYRMQWPHNPSGEIITEEVYEDNDDDVIEEEYLVGEEIIPTNEINAISNTLDQSAAQNLIYMAQEGAGNMAMGDLIEEQVEQADNVDYNDPEYFECQVTEEVITDDWVQRQGEERIEIIIDSIDTGQTQEAGNSAHPDDDIDVSLPTEQDEYTASRPYPCDFCSRRFRKKANLINHMVAHQQERPHVCHLCGARYIRKSDLMQHLKIHAYIPEEQEPNEHEMELMERPLPRIMKRSSNKLSMASAAGRGGLGKSKPNSASFDHLIEHDVKLLCEVGNNKQQQQQSPPNSSSHDSYARQPPAEHRFPVIDPKKPFVCQQCGLSFAREKAMLSHTKSHILETQFECEQCGEVFYDVTLLREHEFTHSNIVEYEHEYEDASTSVQRRHEEEEDFDDEDRDGNYAPQRNRHGEEEDEEEEEEEDDDNDEDYRVEGVEGNYFCDHCGMSFHRVNLLRQHVKTHLRNLSGGDEQEHHCKECGQTFAEALDLLAHAEDHARNRHRPPPPKCLLCGEEKASVEKLKLHVQTVHKDELTELTCGVCGKQCRDGKALQKHSWDHPRTTTSGSNRSSSSNNHSKGSAKATCHICHKSFQNKARLKRHLLSHRKRVVQCDLCLEAFPDGRTLMNHRHSHTTGLAKKFPCKECGKSFGSRSSQQIHVRMHTGERPYGCRFCWKSFADGGTLRKHERIHTGEKPYGCVICPRAFNQRVVLREHIRSHHSGPDPTRSHLPASFYCQLCQMSYGKAEDLISDLIAHCDENTKRQRPIQVGPRKYKRRRKLKPHELKMLRDGKGSSSPVQIELSEEDNLIDSDAATEVAEQKPMRSTSGKRRGMEMDEYYGNSTTLHETATTAAYVNEYEEEEEEENNDQGEEQRQQQQESPQPPNAVYKISLVRPKRTRLSTAAAAAANEATNSAGRPKMIHTEKARVTQADGRRKTTLVTTRTTGGGGVSTVAAAAAVTRATRRSRRGNNYEEEMFVDSSQPQQVETGAQVEEGDERSGEEGLAMSSMELADVLENKKTSDKFSVDIVNDLESILCSPIRPRVSESSTTGADYLLSGMMQNEVEVVMEEDPLQQQQQQQKKRAAATTTIIECRRTYLPSSGTATTTTTTTAGSSGYGIVRVNNNNSSSRNNIRNSSVGGGGVVSRMGTRLIKKESFSTTEDEVETLDDFLQLEPRNQRAAPVVVKREVHKCEICNVVLEGKYELMAHARTHF